MYRPDLGVCTEPKTEMAFASQVRCMTTYALSTQKQFTFPKPAGPPQVTITWKGHIKRNEFLRKHNIETYLIKQPEESLLSLPKDIVKESVSSSDRRNSGRHSQGSWRP